MRAAAQLEACSVAPETLLNSRMLAYGEGFFETMRCLEGRVPLLPWHARRWSQAFARFGWNYSSEFDQQIHDALAASCAGCADGVLKLSLGNAEAARGYRSLEPVPAFLLQRSLAPAARARLRVKLHSVDLDYTLPGLKTLNRQTQCQALRALTSEFDELLLCDRATGLVSVTAGNVYLRHGNLVRTPSLARSGIHGVVRTVLLEQFAGLKCAELGLDALLSADEIFISNALRGVESVALMATDTQQLALSATRATDFARELLSELGFRLASGHD